MGQVLVLNGASSAGKSSLAKALQGALPQPHLHVALDAFRAMEPVDYWRGLDAPSTQRRIAGLCRAMHSAVVAFAESGQHVIFDTALDKMSVIDAFHADLGHLGFRLIGVHCALDELERRETARGDRPSGLARRQLDSIHAGRTYDFSVDTTHASAAECALAIAAWIERGNHASA
jgi:chloramphenicol 3-O phosphotransferase